MNKPTLYTQKGCPMCKSVHMLLDKKGIDYNEVLIGFDEIEKYKEMGITHTPTLQISENCLAEGRAIIEWINQQ